MAALTKINTTGNKKPLKKGNTVEAPEATVEIFWRAYGTLKPRERQALAERILRDRNLLEDLGDHMLIEKAKRVKGNSVTLSEFRLGNQATS